MHCVEFLSDNQKSNTWCSMKIRQWGRARGSSPLSLGRIPGATLVPPTGRAGLALREQNLGALQFRSSSPAESFASPVDEVS